MATCLGFYEIHVILNVTSWNMNNSSVKHENSKLELLDFMCTLSLNSKGCPARTNLFRPQICSRPDVLKGHTNSATSDCLTSYPTVSRRSRDPLLCSKLISHCTACSVPLPSVLTYPLLSLCFITTASTFQLFLEFLGQSSISDWYSVFKEMSFVQQGVRWISQQGYR